MTVWRAALIGCGEIGTQHAEAVAAVPGLEFAAYCDLNFAAAQRLRDRYAAGYATDDLGSVFADDRIDAVYVCTQHDSHVDLCLRAAAAGKHVMVEKPLALTVAECERIGEAVERSGIALMSAFKLRYFDMVQRARELMPRPQMVTMQTMYDRLPDDRWVHDPVRGGGTVVSAGVHSCDLIRFLVDAEPVSVSAVGANFYHRNGLVDNLAAVFRFDNGAVANLIQGDFNCPPYASTFSVQMFREDESLTLTDRLCRLIYRHGTGQPLEFAGSETGIRQESEEFARVLDRWEAAGPSNGTGPGDMPSGDRPPVGYRDGLLATAMIRAAIKSTRTGSPQPIL